MTTTFTSLKLHPVLVQTVSNLGYETPTPIQLAVIPAMLSGQDVIGQAQTGTGKTAAFALPILQNLAQDYGAVQALVLAPTRELAMQVAEAAYGYGKGTGVSVLPVYGGTPYSRQISRLKRGVDIVVGTPGRILDLIQKEVLDLSHVTTVVLDEADEMLSMGFIEDIEAILSETPEDRQTTLFSATMPSAIRRLADSYMNDPQSFTISREDITVSTIEQRYYLVNEKEKLAALTRLFEVEPITSGLIFARTRQGTGELANELTVRGFPAEALHGDMSQDARESVLRRFRENRIKVLVATDVAARGLDIDDISHVINFDLPQDPEIYVHRIGRTGRAGKTGVAMTLLTPKEQWRLRRIEHFVKQSIGQAKLPTVENILEHREAQLMEQVDVWMRRGRAKRERELVEALMEKGHDPMEIAAVALKIARAEEKQRPIAPMSDVMDRSLQSSRQNGRQGKRKKGRNGYDKDNRRNGKSKNYDRNGGKNSHEEGMVRLYMSTGKTHGIRVNGLYLARQSRDRYVWLVGPTRTIAGSVVVRMRDVAARLTCKPRL
jgi:ATP-dependent RNA helicase DeaD